MYTVDWKGTIENFACLISFGKHYKIRVVFMFNGVKFHPILQGESPGSHDGQPPPISGDDGTSKKGNMAGCMH